MSLKDRRETGNKNSEKTSFKRTLPVLQIAFKEKGPAVLIMEVYMNNFERLALRRVSFVDLDCQVVGAGVTEDEAQQAKKAGCFQCDLI